MESNRTRFALIITLLTINLSSVLSNRFIADLLSRDLLDKSSILHLLQLFFTAKLLKDYQEANGLPYDPKTNYMLFLGKGNIKFQNHHLDVQKTTEPIDYETTTISSDLAHNKHLLKFVARNGYDVWKRLLVVPYNSTAKVMGPKPSDTFTESSDIITNMILTTTNYPINEFYSKPNTVKYDPKFVKTLKNLYKPNLQMIETKEGVIKHEVKPPKWVKNIIENGAQKGPRTTKTAKKVVNNNKYIGIDRNTIMKKVKKKATNKTGSVKSDITLPPKHINNKNINNVVIVSEKKNKPTVRPTLQTINKKQNKVIQEKQNNRIGNIVIKGVNALIRGIGSILGIDATQE